MLYVKIDGSIWMYETYIPFLEFCLIRVKERSKENYNDSK